MTKKSNSRSKNSRASMRPQSKLNRLHKKLTLPRSATHSSKKRESKEGVLPVDDKHVKPKKLYLRSSPMKLIRLYPHMSAEQFEIVQKTHFGGLTTIGFSKLYPELCKYVMSSFDPKTCELVFPGRGSVPVNEESVYEVLGVPWGNEDVRYEIDAESTAFFMKQMGYHSKTQPTMKFLEKKILQSKKADWTYLRLWSVYAVSSVVAPTTGTLVSPRIYPSFCNIKEVHKLNVCKFLIRMLRRAAKDGVDRGILKASQLFFMIKYLDSLELEGVEIDQHGMRVSVWNNSSIKEAIRQDTWNDGTFGKAPLKSAFCTIDTETANTDTDNEDCEATVGHTVSENIVSDGNQESDDEQEDKILEGQSVRENVVTCEDQELEDDKPDDAKERQSARHDEDVADADSDARSSDADISRNDASNGGEQKEEHNVLFSEPNNIPLFVKMNTPANSAKEQTKLYTQVVKDACYGFEKGLHNILSQLICKPSKKTYTPKLKQRHAVAKVRKSKLEGSQSDQHSAHSMKRSDSGNTCGTDVDCRNEVTQQTDQSKDAQQAHHADQHSSHEATKHVTEQTGVEHTCQKVVPEGTSNAEKANNHGDCEPMCPLDPQGRKSEITTPADSPVPRVKEGHTVTVKNSVTEALPGTECRPTQNDTKQDTPEQNMAIPHSHIAGADGSVKIDHLVFNHQTDSGSSKQDEGDTSVDEPDSDIFNIKSKHASKFNFMEFVKGPTRKKAEPEMIHFETPALLDLDYCLPRRQEVIDCFRSIKEVKVNNDEGLPSMIDGSSWSELTRILMDIDPVKVKGRKRNAVTFADQSQLKQQGAVAAVPSPSKYMTRSASALEKSTRGDTKLNTNNASVIPQDTSAAKAPRISVSPKKIKMDRASPSTMPSQIVTRSREAMLATPALPKEALREAEGPPELQDSMVRRLNFSSSGGEECKSKFHTAPDAPSFDLGFDTQDTTSETNVIKQTKLGASMTDQQGCSKDHTDEADASKTSVPHEYQKRIIKAPKCLQSPFIDYENKKVYTVSKAVDELYKMVCMLGAKASSKSNGEIVWDNDDLFVNLRLWADSVKPTKKLGNMVCQVAIHIIQAENKNPKKIIMPLRISKYLIDCRLNLKDVQNALCPTDDPQV